jgi:DNA-binding MurR/RpiR family transcriptional regulator
MIEKTIAELSPRQLRVLPFLASAPSIAEAARQTQVSYSTLMRWLQEDDFREELDRLRQEAASLAQSQLQGMMLVGLNVIADALKDPNPAVRLRAAYLSVSFALRSNDLREIQESMARLEDALPLWAASQARRR